PSALSGSRLSLPDALPISPTGAQNWVPSPPSSSTHACALASSVHAAGAAGSSDRGPVEVAPPGSSPLESSSDPPSGSDSSVGTRSEEHTSELQSRENIVCR